MKLMVDGQDYTAALDGGHPLAIERSLNAPSRCSFALGLSAETTLPTPRRLQKIAVCGDDETLYFTGYITGDPLPEYVGLDTEGPVFRLAVEALSDETLLDQSPLYPAKSTSGLTAGQLLSALAVHCGNTTLSTNALDLAAPINSFAHTPGARFSELAGRVAAQARASYRALNATLSLTAIPVTIHVLRESERTLNLAELKLSRPVRRFANDITVCGEHEPAAYVTEIFIGDGVTTQFQLSATPYASPANQATFLEDLFDETDIDPTAWDQPDGSIYFAIDGSGLAMKGGSGVDGETQLKWIDPIEMGGGLLLEATGVILGNASTGILAALFGSTADVAGCVAGFQATAEQGTGTVTLRPVVMGTPAGTAFTIEATHEYALRIRLYCPEEQRQQTTWLCGGDDGVLATGGETIPSPGRLLIEIQDFVNGVAAMPVTLYDGSVEGLPPACSVVAASSLNLQGSMRSIRMTRPASAWVVSTPSGGTAYSRRTGSLAQNAECHVDGGGALVFYAGFAPAVGEQIAVTYRGRARAVGRAVNAASQQALADAGLPSTSAWFGSAQSPRARSSADCRNAASALVQAAAARNASLKGTYRMTNFDLEGDMWPGDALSLQAPSCALDAEVVVTAVTMAIRASVPEIREYQLTFAGDWAGDLAIRVAESVPLDAWLPVPALPVYAANLPSARVVAIGDNTVTVDTTVTPPAGGGFEVRRRDHAFLPGEDSDLVLRGSQPTLTLPRHSWNDRFYIRMFDGATPPHYSEFSAAVFLNVPLSA